MNKMNSRIIITIASRDGISSKFQKQLYAIQPAAIVEISGISDVALARNLQLSESEKTWEPGSVVLMIDDDMDISNVEKVHELVRRAAESGNPSSGLYVDKHGDPTCGPCPGRPGKWVTGLGIIAIPVERLEALKKISVVVSSRGKQFTCYTASRPMCHDEKWEWSSEDYTLSHYLGGVDLHPDLQFGHFKTACFEASPALVLKLEEINKV